MFRSQSRQQGDLDSPTMALVLVSNVMCFTVDGGRVAEFITETV